jgi:mannose-6-phosphate isomerase-like protein (cupin superfamily)
MQNEVVDLDGHLAKLLEPWSPQVVARLNDYEVKIAKLSGSFIWHTHSETDELFLVLSGRITIELRDRTVTLDKGQLFVVPRGVEHRPACEGEAEVLMLEPIGVVNTGDR